MSASVFLDKEKSDILVGLAISEGLLSTRGTFLETKFKDFKCSDSDKSDILLQVVSHDRVILSPNEILYKGDLFDGGAFQQAGYKDVDIPGEIDVKSVLSKYEFGLIAEIAGFSTDHHDWAAIVERFDRARTSSLERFGTDSLLQLSIKMAVSHVKAASIDQEDRKIIEEYRLSSEPLDAVYNVCQSVIRMGDVCDHYNADYFSNLSARLFRLTPFEALATRSDADDLSYMARSNAPAFQLVSAEIGAIPTRRTLKDTIDLAATPEAVALRKKVYDFRNAILVDPATAYENLHKELSYAKSQIGLLNRLDTTNEHLTLWASVPISAIGLFLPLAGVAGIGLSLYGTYGILRKNYAARNFDWTMYGRFK